MSEHPQLRFRLSLQVPVAIATPSTPASPTLADFCFNRIGARGRGLCLRSTLVLKGVLNGTDFDHLLRHPLLLLLLDLHPMPPRKASTRRSTASAVRSQALASPPVSQAPPPPPAMAVGMEQFDLLVQQVRGLTKAVQTMQQQQQQQP